MFQNFLTQIKQIIPIKQIIEDEFLRYAYSTDASLYRMVPQLVLFVKSEADVIKILTTANYYNVKLTFRAAGTSLSGQAVTDQVLVILHPDSWLNYQINNNGHEIKLEPGIIGANANNYLKVYKTKIGPDPSSINTAKIGGIIANNSSGMCCNTKTNSYATLKNIRAIFADGSIFDSSNNILLEEFKLNNQKILSNILAIRNKIIADENLVQFIHKKFSIKNTSGYSLNAFLDFSDPTKILEHLLVGSEGTLCFISNVTLYTVPNNEYKSLNLIYAKLTTLIQLTISISNLDVSAVELLDYLSLKSIADDKDIQKYLINLPDDNYAAIIIEVTGENQAQLQDKINKITTIIANFDITHQIGFSNNPQTISTLLKARSGILATIAAQRPPGSSVVIEDVAVEMTLLSELIYDIRNLCNKFNFINAAIFGHVLSGNIHFVITPNFSNIAELKAYNNFMHEFTNLVVNKFNGSLKAEHGSGRNISPFAIIEWGQKCVDLMWEIKHLLDPKSILNPDVKLTKDTTLHMQHLKSFNLVNSEINQCMECGFCEPICPSRKLSLTPRQRNAIARYITTLPVNKKNIWQKKYQYYGIDTCATTGMCKTVCPVGINTGAFILEQKPKQNKQVNHIQEIKWAKKKVQIANKTASIIGRNTLHNLTYYIHQKIKSFPVYLESLPKIQTHRFDDEQNSRDIVLIPACPNRVFGTNQNYTDYPNKLILQKMGFDVQYLIDNQNMCCGQMYHSKSNQLQREIMQNKLKKTISHIKIAIIDNSSCAEFAQNMGIDLIDINQFIIQNIDRKKLHRKYNKIALHIDCSTAKNSFNQEYLDILYLCCSEIIIPEGIKCCGFAGDKGFINPELNASCLSNLYNQVKDCEIGVTFNRNCQIGLSHHSKIEYISFVEIILNCLYVNHITDLR